MAMKVPWSPEPEQDEVFLYRDTMVYYKYDMPFMEKTLTWIVGAVIGFVLGFIFYDLIYLQVIFAVIVGFTVVPIRRKQIIRKQIKTLKIQFKDMLESVATSIGAGKNIPESFKVALDDMRDQFPDDAYIVKELDVIRAGMNNGVTIENLLLDLSKRSRVDDIAAFADIFIVVREKGGNMRNVVQNTYEIINDKIDIEMEVETTISGSKSELNMMTVMPVLFCLMLNGMGTLTGGGTMKYIATTIGLVLFVVAYVVGSKIMDIKV
jgi:tight adherence protein B